MRALAIIPTLGRSPYLHALEARLATEGVDILEVDNTPTARVPDSRIKELPTDWRFTSLHRPDWRGIYRQWNLGIGLGALCDVPVLVLNDDIVLKAGAATTMVDWLSRLKRHGWGLLGFDYKQANCEPRAVSTHGTYRHGGVGGFAFGVNPRLCARVDLRFRWWGGDDDLVFATERRARVGVLVGCGVDHPEPSYTANRYGDLLPEGWAESDARLLREKWGETWK